MVIALYIVLAQFRDINFWEFVKNLILPSPTTFALTSWKFLLFYVHIKILYYLFIIAWAAVLVIMQVRPLEERQRLLLLSKILL